MILPCRIPVRVLAAVKVRLPRRLIRVSLAGLWSLVVLVRFRLARRRFSLGCRRFLPRRCLVRLNRLSRLFRLSLLFLRSR